MISTKGNLGSKGTLMASSIIGNAQYMSKYFFLKDFRQKFDVGRTDIDVPTFKGVQNSRYGVGIYILSMV